MFGGSKETAQQLAQATLSGPVTLTELTWEEVAEGLPGLTGVPVDRTGGETPDAGDAAAVATGGQEGAGGGVAGGRLGRAGGDRFAHQAGRVDEGEGVVEGVGVAMLAAGLAGATQDPVLLQEASGRRIVGSGPQVEVAAAVVL